LVDKEKLRLAVLEAARQLFMSKGYENVGMRDVAQAIGQQPTQVYRLKLSKSDILAELILELNAMQIERLPKIITKIGDVSLLDKVSSYLESLYELDIEHLPLRGVGAAHGWSWSADYESRNFEQVRKLIAPIASWMTDARLSDVESRCLGVFALYYVGFRNAVIRKSSAKECLEMIKPSLHYLCI
jgi:AcrR family transcriptional regulator